VSFLFRVSGQHPQFQTLIDCPTTTHTLGSSIHVLNQRRHQPRGTVTRQILLFLLKINRHKRKKEKKRKKKEMKNEEEREREKESKKGKKLFMIMPHNSTALTILPILPVCHI
jgi:hypothetical protein